MTPVCLACFEPHETHKGDYHARCLRELFASPTLPRVEIELSKLVQNARQMIGYVSLSGVQQKLSVKKSSDGTRLEVAGIGGQYILKPQITAFPHLPENEALTMRLARLAGIDTPPSGLIYLQDGSLAYLTRRFDRDPVGRKLRLEDFCQLAERPPKEKYEGSYEQCAKIIQRYASAPILQLSRFFRRVLFSWWVGNEDLHRKNLSMLIAPDGQIVLSPAYDIVCSRLHLEDRELALKLGGKDKKIQLKDWQAFGHVCKLNETTTTKMLEKMIKLTDPALDMIDRSLLPFEQKEAYKALITASSGILSEPSGRLK